MVNTNESRAHELERDGSFGRPSTVTTAWHRFEIAIGVMSRSLSVIGIFGVVMLIAVTTIDIVGSKAFNQPLTGSLGLIRLAQLTAISFGMGITFLDGDHVKVEMLSRRLPPKVQATMSSLVNFLGFMLFFLIIWQMISLGRSFQISGEMIDELYIPWYPFIYATVVAFVPVCLALLLELGNSLSRVVKR